jgi:mRNA interferase RelE/StbE
MRKFRVEVKEPAQRQIAKLSPPIARRIVASLESLEQNPYPRGKTAIRLKGHENLYRLRVGDWRVVYEIAGDGVAILYVGKREEVYERGGF